MSILSATIYSSNVFSILADMIRQILTLIFPWDERDRIIDFVFARYGSRQAGMVANHNTLALRAAIREVAKVYGMPPAEMRHVSQLLTRQPLSLTDFARTVARNSFSCPPASRSAPTSLGPLRRHGDCSRRSSPVCAR